MVDYLLWLCYFFAFHYPTSPSNLPFLSPSLDSIHISYHYLQTIACRRGCGHVAGASTAQSGQRSVSLESLQYCQSCHHPPWPQGRCGGGPVEESGYRYIMLSLFVPPAQGRARVTFLSHRLPAADSVQRPHPQGVANQRPAQQHSRCRLYGDGGIGRRASHSGSISLLSDRNRDTFH